MANLRRSNESWSDHAVLSEASERNCFFGPPLPSSPASDDDEIAGPVGFVLVTKCLRIPCLCVLIHPILPGLFAIETCRRSDCFSKIALVLAFHAQLRQKAKIDNYAVQLPCLRIQPSSPALEPPNCNAAPGSVHKSAHPDVHHNAQRQKRKQHGRSAITH